MVKYISVFIFLTLLSLRGMADTFSDNSNSNLLLGDGPAGDTEFIAPLSDDISQPSSQAYSKDHSSLTEVMPPHAADELSEPPAGEYTNEPHPMNTELDNLNPSVADDAPSQTGETSSELAQQVAQEELEQEKYREQADQLLAQEAYREHLNEQRAQAAAARTAHDSLHSHHFQEMDSITSNVAPEKMSHPTELDHKLLQEKIRIAKAKIAEMEAEERVLAEALNMTNDTSVEQPLVTADQMNGVSMELSLDEHGNAIQETDITMAP